MKILGLNIALDSSRNSIKHDDLWVQAAEYLNNIPDGTFKTTGAWKRVTFLC